MSSTPWHHPVLTSCWEGKVGTLLLAHSQSTQRQVPLSLASRPRGGDWSGLYFDNEIFLSAALSRVMDFSRSLDIMAGRALTNSKCGLLCAQQKSTYAFLPFSYQACFTKTPRPSLSLMHNCTQQSLWNNPDLLLPCSVHQSRLLLNNSISFPVFPNNMHYYFHLEEEQRKPLSECFWCWLLGPSQVALDAFFFHSNSMNKICFNH